MLYINITCYLGAVANISRSYSGVVYVISCMLVTFLPGGSLRHWRQATPNTNVPGRAIPSTKYIDKSICGC